MRREEGTSRVKSLLLLSGGMDSIALAVWKRPEIALTIDYGQQSAPGEIRAASKVAADLSIQHEVVVIDLGRYGSGDLAGVAASPHAPVSEWWPFRNQLLLTIAGTVAMRYGAQEIFIGCVATDARHMDGTIAFIDQIDALMSRQEGGVRVVAPAIGMTTVELLRKADVSEKMLRRSFSCHTARYACGTCAGCRKAQSVFAQLRATHV